MFGPLQFSEKSGDALTSDRPYRPAWPEAKALAHLRAETGKHFDPQIAEAFLKLIDE